MGNFKVMALTFALALAGSCSGGGQSVVVNKDLRILDDNDQVTNVVIQGRTLMVEHTGSADTLDIKIGDYVVGTHGTGYLRRVASVTTGPGAVTLETEYASLEQVIESGSFSHTVTMGNGRAGSTLLDLSGKVIAAEVVNGVNVMVTIDRGTIAWNADYNFDGKVGFFKIEKFEAVANGSLNTDWDITVAVDGAFMGTGNIDLNNNAGPAFTQDINFSIGPIPVTGKLELFFKAGYEINSAAAGGFTAGFDANVALEAGATYDENTGWQKIWNPSYTANKHPMTYNSTANLTAKIYVAPIIRTEFYGTPGPKLDLSKTWSGEFNHTTAARRNNRRNDGAPVEGVSQGGIAAPLPGDYAVCANASGRVNYELKVFGYSLVSYDQPLDNNSQVLEQSGTTQCGTNSGPDSSTISGATCSAQGNGFVACPMGGRCIHDSWFCDGINDCNANEDEMFEMDGTTACPPPIVDPGGCGGQGPDWYACPTGGACRHFTDFCDGNVNDCPNNEDEMNDHLGNPC